MNHRTRRPVMTLGLGALLFVGVFSAANLQIEEGPSFGRSAGLASKPSTLRSDAPAEVSSEAPVADVAAPPAGDVPLDAPEADFAEPAGRLQGVVWDADGEPVAMANLFFADLLMGAASGPDGNYAIRGVPAGTHTLTVVHGRAQRELVVEVAPGAVVELDVALE